MPEVSKNCPRLIPYLLLWLTLYWYQRFQQFFHPWTSWQSTLYWYQRFRQFFTQELVGKACSGTQPCIQAQYREYTVGSLSSAMWCSMFIQIYAVYWLQPASSAFLLARKCNWLAAIMVMRCVMRHARTPKFQLSGPTVHSLYCDPG